MKNLILLTSLVVLLASSRIEAKTISNDIGKQTASQESSVSSEDINDLVVLEPAEDDPTEAAPEVAEVVDAVEEAAEPAAPSQEIVAEVETSTQNVDDTNAINRFCKCSYNECKCCRQFRMPLALLGNSGCARIRYMDGDRMSVGLSFGERLVASRVISSRKPTPICMPLPGGYTKFCGRIYGISRRSTDDFQACLGLELRADDEVEAALRVSCFNFGPRGLEMTEAQPLPPVDSDEDEDDDDDDGDDDDDDGDDALGLGGLFGSDDDDDDNDADADDGDDYR